MDEQSTSFDSSTPDLRASARRGRRLCLLMSFGVGILVSLLTFETERVSHDEALSNANGFWVVRQNAQMLHDAAVKFEKTHGNKPASLTDLEAILGHKVPADLWDRPFVMTQTQEDVVIVSYGRDGRPGGRGLDADITNQAIRPDPIPLAQYFEVALLGPVLLTCFSAGFVAALATYYAGVPSRREPVRWGRAIGATLVTTVMAMAIASIVAVLHVPSGH